MTTIQATCTAAIAGQVTHDSSTSPASGSGGNVRKLDNYNKSNVVLNGSSTPAVASEPVDLSHTLSGTSKDWDLTAAPLAERVGVNQDLTGEKLVAILLTADAGNNAGGVTIQPGATNGYNLFGSAAAEVVLLPGQTLQMFTSGASAGAPAVSGTEKVINFTGTSGDIITAIAYFT